MIEAPTHPNEAERIARLKSYAILDTDPEREFDDLSALASRLCGTPIALVSLVDTERQWFKSRVGLAATETPRSVAFCSHAILRPDDVFVVEDALQDDRFSDNPLVTGDPNVVFYAGAPLVAPDGMPVGTLCVIDHSPRQITEEQVETLRTLARHVVSQLELRRTCLELKETASRLEHSNRELEDFARVAAHDLQEPLRKIVSFGDLLREDLGESLPPSAAEDLGYMTDAAERMRRLVQDLLRLSRAGTGELERHRVELESCVQAALIALSARIEDSGAEVTIGPLPALEGDRTLLTQLFQNLICNAVKFVRDRVPRVRITCFEENGETVIGVRDNGIGMDPAAARDIFGTFKRLNSAREFEGTGVGLSIARKAVERHGGRIWAESEPGEGSHFKIVLPGLESPQPA